MADGYVTGFKQNTLRNACVLLVPYFISFTVYCVVGKSDRKANPIKGNYPIESQIFLTFNS
jgi:hypothetical protein